MSRPELTGPAEHFYDDAESSKYAQNSRIIRIQEELSRRSIDLLNLPEGKSAFLLDIGCGSGLSVEAIEMAGHTCIGCDISPSMVKIASERGADDLALHDMGTELPFRPGVFDGCISISAIQWLCYSNKKGEVPWKRLKCFFCSLYGVLKRGSRAVLQLYPETPEQMEMISTSAMQAGFSGGLIVDYPNSTKAKKFYLCLFAGMDASNTALPTPLGVPGFSPGEIENKDSRRFAASKPKRGKKERVAIKSREWVLLKKERQRKQGKDVRKDTKYTARRRPMKF
jgi:18S rRNA (guanine1575-N7)-methyltransferase